MAEIPNNLKFLDSHEWARLEEDGTVTVGISDHAQGLLGDIVFVELPDTCLLYTSPSPRDGLLSRMPSSA